MIYFINLFKKAEIFFSTQAKTSLSLIATENFKSLIITRKPIFFINAKY